AAAGILLGSLLTGRLQPQKVFFNMANVMLGVLAASAIWNTGGSAIGLGSPLAMPWIVTAALAFYVCNAALLAGMIGLVLDLPIALVWRRGQQRVLLANFAVFASGVPVA